MRPFGTDWGSSCYIPPLREPLLHLAVVPMWVHIQQPNQFSSRLNILVVIFLSSC